MPRPYIAVHDAKQAALDALDRLLGSGTPECPEKIAAMKEVAASATRMVRNLERWQRDETSRAF